MRSWLSTLSMGGYVAVFIILSIAISGCGGGGSGGGSAPTGSVNGYVTAPIGGAKISGDIAPVETGRSLALPAGYVPLSGATVQCNGKSATTGANGYFAISGVAAGSQTVTISKSGYTPKQINVVVQANTTTTALPANSTDGALVPAVSGSISVSSTPVAASILMDGAETGFTTPHTFNNVKTGDHTVAARLAGYITATQTVTVASSQTGSAVFPLAQRPATHWKQVYSWNILPYSFPVFINQDVGGGYHILGNMVALGNMSARLAKLDLYGEVSWFYDYANSNVISAFYTGGNVIASGINSSNDFWNTEIDSSGNKISENAYPELNQSYSIRQTNDGGFIKSMLYFQDTRPIGSYPVVKRYSPAGSLVWRYSLSSFGNIGPDSIVAAQDGTFAVVGGKYDSSGENEAGWLARLDSDGNVLTSNFYNGKGYGEFKSITEAGSGALVAAGHTYNTSTAQYEAWAIKVDSSGGKVWERTFQYSSGATINSIRRTSDGGFIAVGQITCANCGYDLSTNDNGDYWILKLDSSGQKLWEKKIGGSGLQAAWAVQQTSDGGYITTGADFSTAPGGLGDLWAIKLDSSGNCDGCF